MNLIISTISAITIMYMALFNMIEQDRQFTVSTRLVDVLPIKKEVQKVAVIQQPSVTEQVALAAKQINVGHKFLFNLHQIDKSLYCMAMNTFYEARGESMVGKVAVNLVVMNRTRSKSFPATACGVVQQDFVTDEGNRICQFSWVCDDKTSIPIKDENGETNPRIMAEWRDSVISAMIVQQKRVKDFVQGATHFYVYQQVQPSWSKPSKFKVTKVIESHAFGKPRS